MPNPYIIWGNFCLFMQFITKYRNIFKENFLCHYIPSLKRAGFTDIWINHYENVHLALMELSQLFPRDAGSQKLAGYLADETKISKAVHYLAEAKRYEVMALNEIRRNLIQ